MSTAKAPAAPSDRICEKNPQLQVLPKTVSTIYTNCLIPYQIATIEKTSQPTQAIQ